LLTFLTIVPANQSAQPAVSHADAAMTGSLSTSSASKGIASRRPTTKFFERATPPPGTTIVITSPPFSCKQEVLARLVAWNVPFVLLLPTIVLQRDFFIDLVRVQPNRFRVVLPTKTVRFHRAGVLQQSPAFKSAYYCFDCSAAARRCACLGQHNNGVELQSLSIDICLVDQ
jgi:hypothetical protein